MATSSLQKPSPYYFDHSTDLSVAVKSPLQSATAPPETWVLSPVSWKALSSAAPPSTVARLNASLLAAGSRPRSSKPKAEDGPEGCCIGEPGRVTLASGASGLQPPTTITPPPQTESIEGIIREHCRSRLYVPPIAWTSDQLQLLGCRFAFEELQGRRQGQSNANPVAEKKSATQQETEQRHRQRIHAASRLRKPGIASWWKAAVEELLEAYNIRPFRPGLVLRFCYGGHSVTDLQTDGIFSLDSTAPFLAYINLETIQLLRERHVRRSKRQSTPVVILQERKLRSLKPLNTAEDPYIIAILIALAQEQQLQRRQNIGGGALDAQIRSVRSEETEASSHEADSFEVCVLAIPGPRAQVFHVYKASIPSGFLDKFEKPSRFLPSCPVLVSYYKISLAKPEKLVKHLFRLLEVPTDE